MDEDKIKCDSCGWSGLFSDLVSNLDNNCESLCPSCKSQDSIYDQDEFDDFYDNY